MNKILKKSISFILAMTFVFFTATFYNIPLAEDESYGTDYPLIYVSGQGTPLYIVNNGTKEEVYPVDYNTDELMQIAKDNIDVFVKALITQEWTEFGNVVRDVFVSLFSPLAIDENGESVNEIQSSLEYTVKSLRRKEKINGQYSTKAFNFSYDWRLDPYKNAEILHQYIEDVMTATGYDHVALLGRCEGTCVTEAYLDKYNCQYVSNYIEYSGATNGVTFLSKCFSGDLYLDADSIERFVYDIQLSSDEIYDQLIKSFITVLNKTYGLDLACWAFNNVWEDIYLDTMPQTFIETFGTWPGFWSMVSDEDYVRAKENVFHNADLEKWANFIDIIDNYHYNVQVKSYENLKKYAQTGLNVFIITKYGYQTVPVSKDGEVISDGYVTVTNASFGATTTSLFTVFDNDYIENANINNTLKYISPDKQIDASTCIFPERTWFIKNVNHKEFPDDINKLINTLVNNEAFSINSDEHFPQYMVYTEDKIVPMDETNMNTTDNKYNNTFLEALKKIIDSLFKLLKRYMASSLVQ